MAGLPTLALLLLLAPLILFALPMILLASPLLVTAWLTLVVLQSVAPGRLPFGLKETSFLMHSAAVLTSTIRIIRGATSRKPPTAQAASSTLPPRKSALPKQAAHTNTHLGLDDLEHLEAQGRYAELQSALRKAIREDPALAFSHPSVKHWIGKRWRNLLLQYAAEDPVAVAAASRRRYLLFDDSRPVAQRLAEKFLKLPMPVKGVHEWQLVDPADSPSDGDIKPLPKATPLPDLSNSAMLLFIPGIITGMLPVREFQPEMAEVQAACGMDILRAAVHPLRGSEGNMADIRAALEKHVGYLADLSPSAPQPPPPPPESVVVIAYSKGMTDLLEFLCAHPEWQPKIKAVFSWAGVVGGSPLADNVYRSVRDWDLARVMKRLDQVLNWICPIVNLRRGTALQRLDEMDIQDAIRSITVGHRAQWLAQHADALQELRVPIFSITASCLADECAYFNASGWMLLNMHDANNDMQVTQEAALMNTPLSSHLAVLHANHWDISFGNFPASMTLGSRKLVHPFPKAAALTAMISLVHELGLA